MEEISEQIKSWQELDERKTKRKAEKKLKGKTETDFYKNLGGNELTNIIEEIISFDIVDEMYHRGYIPKIYNGCYGGFGWSKGAVYLIDHIENYIGLKKKEEGESRYSSKEDDIDLVIEAKVINYMNSKNHYVGDVYGKPVFDFVKKDLKKFINVSEYDGLESLHFDQVRYFFESVKEIIASKDNNDEKIAKIEHTIKTDFTDPIIDSDEVNEIITPYCDRFDLQVLKVEESEIENFEEPEDEWIEVAKKVRTTKNIIKNKKFHPDKGVINLVNGTHINRVSKTKKSSKIHDDKYKRTVIS